MSDLFVVLFTFCTNQSWASVSAALLKIYHLGTPGTIFLGLMLALFGYESGRIVVWLRNPHIHVFFFPSWFVFTKAYELVVVSLKTGVFIITWLDQKIRNRFWTPYEDLFYYNNLLIVLVLTPLKWVGVNLYPSLLGKRCSCEVVLTMLGFIDGIYQTCLYVKYWILFTISFFRLAFFSSYVTWILVLFYYRIFLDQDLYPRKRTWRTPRDSFVQSYAYLSSYYSTYFTMIPSTSLLKQATVEKLLSDLVFLKRYYRLNDLIWQDGMLIDFLQKKVADRWVRTFVIYSGYLFNERFVFDFVVRFYIDYVIWPTYRTSIYEFNNVSSTLSWTLFLLIAFFFIFSLYYFSFFFL